MQKVVGSSPIIRLIACKGHLWVSQSTTDDLLHVGLNPVIFGLGAPKLNGIDYAMNLCTFMAGWQGVEPVG
jgi:hypothetical protein